MRTNMLLALALCAMAQTTTATANEPPPVPEGGLNHLYSAPCQDRETGEEGTCYFMQDVQGNSYIAFWQGETLQFIRQVFPDRYENIWVNDMYNSY